MSDKSTQIVRLVEGFTGLLTGKTDHVVWVDQVGAQAYADGEHLYLPKPAGLDGETELLLAMAVREHAKLTRSQSREFADLKGKLLGYASGVEDARIKRDISRQFPGAPALFDAATQVVSDVVGDPSEMKDQSLKDFLVWASGNAAWLNSSVSRELEKRVLSSAIESEGIGEDKARSVASIARSSYLLRSSSASIAAANAIDAIFTEDQPEPPPSGGGSGQDQDDSQDQQDGSQDPSAQVSASAGDQPDQGDESEDGSGDGSQDSDQPQGSQDPADGQGEGEGEGGCDGQSDAAPDILADAMSKMRGGGQSKPLSSQQRQQAAQAQQQAKQRQTSGDSGSDAANQAAADAAQQMLQALAHKGGPDADAIEQALQAIQEAQEKAAAAASEEDSEGGDEGASGAGDEEGDDGDDIVQLEGGEGEGAGAGYASSITGGSNELTSAPRELVSVLLRHFADKRKLPVGRAEAGSRVSVPDFWRLRAMGDTRVFQPEGSINGIDSAVWVLLDRSGSMSSILETAADAAHAFALALQRISRMETSMSVFPGSRRASEQLLAFREPHKKLRKALEGITADGGTPMGEAMADVLPELIRHRAKRKTLFVITDGEPDDPSSVRRQVLAARAAGVEVIGVGIGSHSMRDSSLFERFERIERVRDLPSAMGRVFRGVKRQPAMA